jgi:hypothetical protein
LLVGDRHGRVSQLAVLSTLAGTRSNPFKVLHRPLISNASGVDGPDGLEEENVRLPCCNRLVLDTPRNDEELSRLEPDFAVTKLDRQTALEHEEELVFSLVTVPDELALRLRDLDVLPVELADDARAPVFAEEAELLSKV